MDAAETRFTKVVSRIYVQNGHREVIAAEVVENPGLGFSHLIRIAPEHSHNIAVFAKCARMCGVDATIVDSNYIDDCIERQFLRANPSVALIIDGIVY